MLLVRRWGGGGGGWGGEVLGVGGLGGERFKGGH